MLLLSTLAKDPAATSEKSPALPPLQWSEFLTRNLPVAPVAEALPATQAVLEQVNAEVNGKITPGDGLPPTTTGGWLPWRSPGWCGDYVVTKRQLLLEKGWPADKLQIAEVLTAFGEEHAILIATLPDGLKLTLDNRVDVLRAPSHTGYKCVKLQSAEDPNVWFSCTTLP